MISVLVIGYNRPDLLESCISSILTNEYPVEIFVHLDGPKNEKEKKLTDSCSKVVENFTSSNLQDLRLEAHKSNLGCKQGVRCALRWFFSHRESGLILEDDIVLLPGALNTTAFMLDKYELDHSIGQISLSNQLARNYGSRVSYFYSNYPFIWGWATWRDRWQTNIENIGPFLNSFQQTIQARNIRSQIGRSAFDFWMRKFSLVSKRKVDTWDFQWHFSNWYHGRKAIMFNRNFAINIGFDDRATHTRVPLSLDLKNMRQLTRERSESVKVKKAKFRFISISDRRLSSRIFGIPDYLFHPLKFWILKFRDLASRFY